MANLKRGFVEAEAEAFAKRVWPKGHDAVDAKALADFAIHILHYANAVEPPATDVAKRGGNPND